MNDHSGGGVWEALAEPTRRRAVELLGETPMRPSELADRLGVSRPALSRHLRVLRNTGLVSVTLEEDDARSHLYRLDPNGLAGFQAWLDQVQAHWAKQLGEFRRYAEQQHDDGPGSGHRERP